MALFYARTMGFEMTSSISGSAAIGLALGTLIGWPVDFLLRSKKKLSAGVAQR